MKCPSCGAQNQESAPRCLGCGQALSAASLGDDAAMRMPLPVGRSWVAIVAGYVGLFAVAIVPAPLALLLGILAVVHIKKNPDKHGMAARYSRS